MAEVVTLNQFRQKIAARMAGGAAPYPMMFMAFGNGGHNPDNTPKVPSVDATSLNNELLRKPLLSITQEDFYSVTGVGRIEPSELVGYGISEAAIVDSNNQLIALKNFAPKFKENDEGYNIVIKMRF